MEIQKKEIIVKPKRQKIDDSKNGDYFTFCRNKKCNQPLYKNRSNMDTRYCMECLQKGNMTKINKTFIFNNKEYLVNADTVKNKLTIRHGKINHVESLHPNIEKLCENEGISLEEDLKNTVEHYADIQDDFNNMMEGK